MAFGIGSCHTLIIFYSGATTVTTLSFSNTPPRDYTMLKSPPEEQIKQAAKRRRDNNGVSIPSPEDVADTLK